VQRNEAQGDSDHGRREGVPAEAVNAR